MASDPCAPAPRPIEDYGLIGNLQTAALVARDGSIDWLCLPRFDSDACFAALLGGSAHGRWRIASHDDTFATKRRYLPRTAILETRFETAGGAFSVTDFMPPGDDDRQVELVRLVRGLSGRPRVSMELTTATRRGSSMRLQAPPPRRNCARPAVAEPSLRSSSA